MNPRLVKFTVELQTGNQEISTEKKIEFKNSRNKFLNFFKMAKVTVPIEK